MLLITIKYLRLVGSDTLPYCSNQIYHINKLQTHKITSICKYVNYKRYLAPF